MDIARERVRGSHVCIIEHEKREKKENEVSKNDKEGGL